MGFDDESERDEERRYLLESGQTSCSNDQRTHVDPKVNYFERKRRQKLLKKYYGEQDHLIDLYEQDAELLARLNTQEIMEQAKEDQNNKMIWDQRFASIVFVVNLLVFGGNLTASILSGSYSVISAFIDSLMDIMSSIVVYVTIWAINNTDPAKYPRGRQRLELIAVIGCSIFMGSANILMIIQSVQAIITQNVDPDANLPTIIIILSSVSVKILLMIVCYRHGSTNSKILALDQRNDIITSVVALAGAYIGDHYFLYADPIGAILVCSFVAGSWFCNAISQVPLIVGRQAEQEEISRILAISLDHDSRILCFDHIMVYHVGERALVELHVVLDEHLPLKITHDICEKLQDKINSLNFVERCFIHVDYYCDGHVDSK